MKTEKIHRPSELKSGDTIKFFYLGHSNQLTGEIHGSFVDIYEHSIFPFKHKRKDVFSKYFTHVERIIAAEKPEKTVILEGDGLPETPRGIFSFANGTKSNCNQPIVDNTNTPPTSPRNEKYDLISKESIDTIDNTIKKLEYVVELTKKLKKLGVKIKL